MSSHYPRLKQRISDAAEGDEEFQHDLTKAIFLGLTELKKVYSEGYIEKDVHKIQQIRHKLKTTLTMFDLDPIMETLQEGKDILESQGFGQEFEAHFNKLIPLLKLAIEMVEDSLNQP